MNHVRQYAPQLLQVADQCPGDGQSVVELHDAKAATVPSQDARSTHGQDGIAEHELVEPGGLAVGGHDNVLIHDPGVASPAVREG